MSTVFVFGKSQTYSSSNENHENSWKFMKIMKFKASTIYVPQVLESS